MSGDVQPRKRKDKKKKKDSSSDRAKAEAEFIARKLSLGDESDEGASVPGKTSHSSILGEGDSIIHLHHEAGTGGHWCAKIVFFSLLAVLVFLIGLILVENRGLTDLDVPASESRYAQLFDGWIDEGPIHDDHHDEHTLELKHGDLDSHEEDHDDDHDADVEYLEEEHGHTDYEHSDGEEDEAGTDGDEEHDEQSMEDKERDSTGNDEDDQEDDTAEDDDDEIPEIDYNGDEAEDAEDNDDDDYLGVSNEIYDADEDTKAADDNYYLGGSNEDDDDNANNDDDLYGNDDDDAEKPFEEVDSNEENIVDNGAIEEELLAKKAEQLAQEEEDSGVGMRVGIGVALVVVAYCVLARKLYNASDKDDNGEGVGDLTRRMTLIGDVNNEGDEYEEEEIEQPPPIKSIASSPVTTTPPVSSTKITTLNQKPAVPLSAEATRIRQVIHKYIEDDEEEPVVKPVKEVVQEKVTAPVDFAKPKELAKEESVEEDVEEITQEEIQNIGKGYEDQEEEEGEEVEEDEDLEEEEIEEEIEEEDEIEEEISDDGDDAELMRKLEEKYGKLPQNDEYQAEEQNDDEPVPPTPARKKGKSTGGNAVEDGENEEWVNDVSSEQWKEQLELAQAEMDEGHLDESYRQFTALTLTNKSCPFAKLGLAKVLEAMAESKRSNSLLDKAIEAYKEILDMKNIKSSFFLHVANRTIAKMRFRGTYLDAVPIHNKLIALFPDKVKYRNDLAITYLMVNKGNRAREVLKNTLSKWPNDGVALVHYGFILKTQDNNLADGVKFMQKGVDVGGEGTLDGRFLFHLGDGYARLGNLKKANEIYELGASIGVFLSPLQRSLYNVDKLTGRPWWTPEQTPYGKLIQDLEKNWKEIATEAKKLHSAFEPEHENLKDTGDWSQFQLFVRGREINKNCIKCPLTCSIVKREISAWNCRRGQIKFSAMQPGTHVFAHTGPTNCRIRAHLGLTGTNQTFIRVAHETRSWKEGKVFIFDDSFEHEVWHNGTQLRIVLIVDLWHPELTKEERNSLPAI